MLKKAAITIGALALLIAVPVLAKKATGQSTSHVQKVRSCLQDAVARLQENSESGRIHYLQELEDLKKVQKSDLNAAWAQREAAIKAGRISISKNNRRGQVMEDLKAEKKVFEAAKAKAEVLFEATKKAVAEKRQRAAQAARNEWIAAQAATRIDYLSAKDVCKK